MTGRDLLDDDGENKAVRTFLQLYGSNNNPTVQQMRDHMDASGFDGCWPEWATSPSNFHLGENLTKAGAQDWLRHLFSLEHPVAASAELTAKELSRYDALEREHLGDPDKQTGIYAEQIDGEPRSVVQARSVIAERKAALPVFAEQPTETPADQTVHICQHCNERYWDAYKHHPCAAQPQLDQNVEDLREMLKKRSEVGLAKYGTTTMRADLSLRDWLQHALEETLDKAVYLRAAIRKLDEDRSAVTFCGGKDAYTMKFEQDIKDDEEAALKKLNSDWGDAAP